MTFLGKEREIGSSLSLYSFIFWESKTQRLPPLSLRRSLFLHGLSDPSFRRVGNLPTFVARPYRCDSLGRPRTAGSNRPVLRERALEVHWSLESCFEECGTGRPGCRGRDVSSAPHSHRTLLSPAAVVGLLCKGRTRLAVLPSVKW